MLLLGILRQSCRKNTYLYSDLQIRDIMQFFGHKKESTFMKYVQVQRPIDTNKIIDIFGGNLKKVS